MRAPAGWLRGPRTAILWAAAGVALAAGVAYSNSLSGPFLFDDPGSITNNPTIRDLSRIREVLSPPRNETVGGRPLLNLSLALNRALGGDSVRGYHVVNLAIHILAGWALFGVVRRTMLRPRLRERFGAVATSAGFALALLWTLHPLQTESVTYVVQRAESLAGLFYLLTLYAFIRALEVEEGVAGGPDGAAGRASSWRWLSVAACILGVGTKEVLVSAPLVVWLYDRIFATFRGAAGRPARAGYFAALFGSWIPLGVLVAGTGGRAGTIGLEPGGTLLSHAATQCWALLQYLKLAFWPHPLVFDYGLDLEPGWPGVLAGAVVAGALLVATGLALHRRPALGFVGVFFLAVLAPSSSVPLRTEPLAEHRMYLPLAAVLVVPVAGLFAWWSRERALVACLAGGMVFAALTLGRNHDYRSAVSLWSGTVAKRPHNARALNNLGMALAAEGRSAEALPWFERALVIDPRHVEAANNLGGCLINLGRPREALPHLESALRADPGSADASANLGTALTDLGRAEEALAHFETAVRARADFAEAEQGWGQALSALGRFEEAAEHYEAALRLRPEYAEAENNLGVALFELGRLEAAGSRFARALELDPRLADAANGLGAVLARQGRLEEARAQFRAALGIRPDHPDAARNLVRVEGPGGRVR